MFVVQKENLKVKEALNMRKILEFPQINENDLGKVAELIEVIADNLDKDCSTELKELQNLTGKTHEYEEFAEYWGWTDLNSLARITLTPEPPLVRDLERDELETIIEIIKESYINGEDDKGRYYEELLHKSLSIPDVMSSIMSNEDVKTIAGKMLSTPSNVILL